MSAIDDRKHAASHVVDALFHTEKAIAYATRAGARLDCLREARAMLQGALRNAMFELDELKKGET